METLDLSVMALFLLSSCQSTHPFRKSQRLDAILTIRHVPYLRSPIPPASSFQLHETVFSFSFNLLERKTILVRSTRYVLCTSAQGCRNVRRDGAICFEHPKIMG